MAKISLIAFSFICIFLSANLLADTIMDKPVWKKPTPIFDQKFDWLRLTSDEWLKGDIISLYDDELEFDSDEFNKITFDWDDVAELRSRFDKSIRLTNGLVVEGFLVIKDSKVTILSNGSAQEFPLSELMTITSSAEQRINLWSGDFKLGAQVYKGNTDKIEYTLTSSLQRKTPLTRFKTDLSYNLSKTKNEAGQYITTADDGRLTSYLDWFYSAKIFFRLIDFEHTSNAELNLDSRNTIGSALGYHLFDTKRTQWDISIGPSYQRAVYSSPDTEETSGVISIDTLLEYEITSQIDYVFDYQLQFVNEALGKRIHYLKTGLVFDLINDIDIDISFIVERSLIPVAESSDQNDDIPENEIPLTPDKNDYSLIVSFGYSF